MKIISGGRRSGKTTKIIEHIRTYGGYLAVFSSLERKRLETLYPFMKGKIIVYNVVVQQNYRRGGEGVYIDNLDMCIPNLKGFTITGPMEGS